MQQFQVPQFIEHEAKLIGPFTVRQSAILGGVGAILFVLWFMVAKFLFFLLAFIIVTAAVLLAFIKINGRPLLDFFMSFFSFFISPQLYIWQKRKTKKKIAEKFVKKKNPGEDETKELTKEQIMALAERLNVEK